MSSENTQAGGGVGFLGLLGILFIGLKLGGIINWSWWIVLLPIYGPLVLLLIILFSVLLFFACAGVCHAVFAAAIYRKIS